MSGPAVKVIFGGGRDGDGSGGGAGGGGRWGHSERGGATHSTDGYFDEVHHIFKLIWEGLLGGVWNQLRDMHKAGQNTLFHFYTPHWLLNTCSAVSLNYQPNMHIFKWYRGLFCGGNTDGVDLGVLRMSPIVTRRFYV